ncbi:MAG: tetratricopeptide repeat protein [candidate division KSB1 bacterium]|nr:tetratricopeptide repeat protein [candidate division KSB1 bacterium]MDQ7064825.1 tetratricopeptide repeat protein [candidate division KSB1 bacterium]
MVRPIVVPLFLAFALCLTLLMDASAQNAKARQWIERGQKLLQQNRLKQAQNSFKKALKLDKSAMEARRGLGQVAFRREKWGDAIGQYKKIIEVARDDLDAHYHLGISYRERGTFKSLLLRKFDWDNAKKHFMWIIVRNEHFQDVLYQYAILKRYRGKYEEAITLAQEQIELRPDMAEAHAGLMQLYRALIRHRRQKQAEAWLRQQRWPQARFALGELWRRKGRIDAADSLFQELLQSQPNMSLQPILLALAKIAYQRNRPQVGEDFFWRAVAQIRSHVDAQFVFEEIKYIVNEQEMTQFSALATPEEKIEFFRQFFARRDPTPAAAYNARLQEHFKRLLYAEKHYEFDGFRTWFNSPDKLNYLKFPSTYKLSSEFNDKGLIYIRHGEPDERQVTVSGNVPTNESWRYWQSDNQPELIFHFVIDENAAGNNWRLTPVIAYPEMLEDRVDWGSVYYRLLTADAGDLLRYENEMAEENRQFVEVGFKTDRHHWPDSIKALNLFFAPATFRGQGDSTVVEIFYGVPLKDLAASTNNGRALRFEQGLAVQDTTTWRTYYKTARYSLLRPELLQSRPDANFIERFRFQLPPGDYRVSLHVRPEGTRWLGGYQFDLTVPDYHAPTLAVSDLQLAYQINAAPGEKSKFKKGDLQVVVNPSRSFSRQQPVYAYFEIYHLQPGDDGVARYRIEYTMKLLKSRKRGLKKVFGFLGGGGKSSISLSTDREHPGETAIEWVSFDVSQLQPGKYRMILQIRDLTSGRTVEQSSELWVE